VGRNDAGLMRDTHGGELLGGMLHRFPIGLGPHDDGD
jgi:hypothetical protein